MSDETENYKRRGDTESRVQERTSSALVRVGAVATAVVAIFGAVGGWVVIPYQVDVNSKELERLKVQVASDHELLVRIDMKVDAIRERLGIQSRQERLKE
jgi:spore coat protein CotH